MKETTFLLRYGELTLKSTPVRRHMVRCMLNNLKDALRRRGIASRVEQQWARAFLHTEQPQETAEVLSNLFGLRSFSRVKRFPYTDFENLCKEAMPYFIPQIEGKTFAVRSKRSKQNKEFSTRKVETELGGSLYPYAGGVDLKNPEITCYVEHYEGEIYLYATKHQAPGGLPTGVESSCLALISGGFDSPVATWLALRRGVPCDFLFFELGGLTHRGPIYAHLQHLYDQWIFGRRPKLYVVPGEPIMEALRENVEPKYWNVMLKRIFYRVGDLIARRLNYTALVTGEAIAQVSSQTLTNLRSIAHNIPTPVLRPLLTYEKQEIIDLARHIGSEAISERVREYCAITPSKPSTAASVKKVLAFEQAMNGEQLYSSLLEQQERLRIDQIMPEQIRYLHVLTDDIPEDSTWIDMRENPHPSLSHPAEVLSLPELVAAPEQLSTNSKYFLLCEVGMQSTEAAYMLQELGYQAYAYEGGIERLRKKSPSNV